MSSIWLNLFIQERYDDINVVRMKCRLLLCVHDERKGNTVLKRVGKRREKIAWQSDDVKTVLWRIRNAFNKGNIKEPNKQGCIVTMKEVQSLLVMRQMKMKRYFITSRRGNE